MITSNDPEKTPPRSKRLDRIAAMQEENHGSSGRREPAEEPELLGPAKIEAKIQALTANNPLTDWMFLAGTHLEDGTQLNITYVKNRPQPAEDLPVERFEFIVQRLFPDHTRAKPHPEFERRWRPGEYESIADPVSLTGINQVIEIIEASLAAKQKAQTDESRE